MVILAYNLVDTGEEFIMDLVASSGETFVVGLYNDSTDNLSDSDDLSAITTEPDNTNSYARQNQSASGTNVDISGTNALLNFPTQTFDVSTNSENVDSYFVIVNFDSDVTGDAGTPTDHLFFNGALSQTRDLSQIGTLVVNEIGGNQD